MKAAALGWVMLSGVLGAAACGPPPKPAERPRPLDPERNSGEDVRRSGARVLLPNRIVKDEVNAARGDKTDWLSVTVAGKPGILTVQLQWDDPAAVLDVDVYDGFGEQVAKSPEAPGPVKTLAVDIPAPGTFYLRVQAHGARDGSRYSLEAKWAGDELIPLPATAPVASKDRGGHDRPRPPVTGGGASFEGDVQGRIVSSYREGDGTVLHLDKGSAAGVKVGSRGAVLDGPAGEVALDGGSFTVTSVIDEQRAIAKTRLKSLGHNTRVSIKTGR